MKSLIFKVSKHVVDVGALALVAKDQEVYVFGLEAQIANTNKHKTCDHEENKDCESEPAVLSARFRFSTGLPNNDLWARRSLKLDVLEDWVDFPFVFEFL